jgi:hypothetical protein
MLSVILIHLMLYNTVLSVIMVNIVLIGIAILNAIKQHAECSNAEWRHDTQHYNIQYKDTEQKGLICDTQHK